MIMNRTIWTDRAVRSGNGFIAFGGHRNVSPASGTVDF